jgi:asparagine synthase (glutamine-hydrolysing)
VCGIATVVGRAGAAAALVPLVAALSHRGPDAENSWTSADGAVALGHTRLAILDRSPTGAQPMVSPDGRHVLVFNGEVYNFRELRAELAADWRFVGSSDTEVLLAAYVTWGPACLDRLLGMFAFAVWDTRDQTLFAARDRLGVKPLYLHLPDDGGLVLASEVSALQSAGIATSPNPAAWASYLSDGRMEWPDRSFWLGATPLPAGHRLHWHDHELRIEPWYDLASTIVAAGPDERSAAEVLDEYEALVRESVALRFRSDVPVGISVSGGLDSSTLLALVDALGPDEGAVHAFTFTTGDPAYDELPWVERLLEGTSHPLHECRLDVADVPRLAADVQRTQDGPFGGLPTIAYAQLFERAREAGVVVLLDGQGMDEQWAGYDYYRRRGDQATVQGSTSAPTRRNTLRPELLEVLELAPAPDSAGAPDPLDPLVEAQLLDLTRAKLPRALRFNDRASMRSSCELREPFLDHRLIELALRQPAERKISATTGKVMLRTLARERLGARDVGMSKRPVQTPQREWLRGPLQPWVRAAVDDGLAWQPDWLDAAQVRTELEAFFAGEGDNSFFVWQWASLGLIARLT